MSVFIGGFCEFILFVIIKIWSLFVHVGSAHFERSLELQHQLRVGQSRGLLQAQRREDELGHLRCIQRRHSQDPNQRSLDGSQLQCRR